MTTIIRFDDGGSAHLRLRGPSNSTLVLCQGEDVSACVILDCAAAAMLAAELTAFVAENVGAETAQIVEGASRAIAALGVAKRARELNPATKIRITGEDDYVEVCTWAEFVRDNEGEDFIAEVARELRAGESVHIGGGAAPAVRLEIAEGDHGA